MTRLCPPPAFSWTRRAAALPPSRYGPKPPLCIASSRRTGTTRRSRRKEVAPSGEREAPDEEEDGERETGEDRQRKARTETGFRGGSACPARGAPQPAKARGRRALPGRLPPGAFLLFGLLGGRAHS